ncbi:alpha/beta hydrolase family protein [Burkholderia cepacia]|uniref:alpha/beta hydrolase family protein n=1 Tax=Burkholderia cepacia TaxID=292 RepID=UPI002AB695D3|nr:hypothetical protein [Burkholderia cepacia]
MSNTNVNALTGLDDEDFPRETVMCGVPAPTEAQCRALGNSVWVEIDGKGDCLRYWSSGLTEDTGIAVFYFHGDRIWFGEVAAYDDNTAVAQLEYANQAAATLGMAFVKVARPGLYGSSGSHSASRQMREMKLVEGAVREILKRHKVKRFGFAGQSGGGSIAAYLMTRFPEAECVAFTAACLSLNALRKAGQKVGGYDYGHPAIYDPIAHLHELKPTASRQIFVIGDEKDKAALFPNLLDFYEAAKAAGHNIVLIRAEGLRNHVLDATGQHAVAWCLQGATASEVASRIAAKGVIN